MADPTDPQHDYDSRDDEWRTMATPTEVSESYRRKGTVADLTPLAALQQFVRHHRSCAKSIEAISEFACDCGLVESLKAVRRQVEGAEAAENQVTALRDALTTCRATALDYAGKADDGTQPLTEAQELALNVVTTVNAALAEDGVDAPAPPAPTDEDSIADVWRVIESFGYVVPEQFRTVGASPAPSEVPEPDHNFPCKSLVGEPCNCGVPE